MLLGSPNDCLEVELVDVFLGERETLAKQVEMEVVVALDEALDLVEADVVVNYVGVEHYFEVDILVGTDEALSRVDAEELFAERQVPAELGPDVTQVGQLHMFHQLRIDDHWSKSNSLLH